MGRTSSTCPELPLTVVEEILLNLPGQQVICVCRLVCNAWKSVVDSTAFWKERCRREGYKLLDNHRVPRDCQAFYILCKKRRNLLKNPNAKKTFGFWDHRCDQWAVENMFKPHPDETVTKCFVTSYGRCIKTQLISLEEEGYSPAFMFEIQPDIVITDWYAPRWDCGSEYQICVELLNPKKEVIHVFQSEKVTFPQCNDQEWNKITHVFKDNGPGVRFIHFKHGGHSGIRVTNSSVELFPAKEKLSDNLEHGSSSDGTDGNYIAYISFPQIFGHVCGMLSRKLGQQLGRPTQSLSGWLVTKFLKWHNQILEENAVKLCEIQPDETVLEIGHGPGLGLQQAVQLLTGSRGKLLGVDYSTYMHHMATYRMQEHIARGKVDLYNCDVTAMPFENSSVDKVFHCNCYYYWPDLKAAASEIHRVMKP
ncbi:F-box only protein 6-like, partial [Clarias magur]